MDPLASSFYAISPPDWDWGADRVESFLQEYNPRMLQILTIHEGYPGHYVQLEYAHWVPSLVRKVLQSGVYIEGWAVYTEQMMLDEGYGGGDLRLRLMQLKFYLRAVANALIAHNMHCTEIADDDVLRFLIEEAFQSEAEARAKITRVKQSSTQLSTYFVGRTAMYRLRQQMHARTGRQVQSRSLSRGCACRWFSAGEVFARVSSRGVDSVISITSATAHLAMCGWLITRSCVNRKVVASKVRPAGTPNHNFAVLAARLPR